MNRNHKTIIFAAVLAMACAACQPNYVGPTNGRTVAVVGDSITHYSESPIASAFPKDRRSVEGIPSIDLPDGRTRLVKPVASTAPDVVVVELGVNSAREVWTSDDAHQIDLIMRDLADVPCVVWVTPTALSPSYFDHLGKGTIASRIEQMRKSVARRVAQYPNLHLADFGAVQGKHAEWFQADHLHPNAEGQKALATFMQMAVADAC